MGLNSNRVDELVGAMEDDIDHDIGARGPWGRLYSPSQAADRLAALRRGSAQEERDEAGTRLNRRYILAHAERLGKER